MMRANTYNSATGQLVIPQVGAKAFDELAQYYAEVFSQGRTEYAIPKGALSNPARLRELSAFFGGRRGLRQPSDRGKM